MGFAVGAGTVHSGTVEHDVDIEILPREEMHVALMQDANTVTLTVLMGNKQVLLVMTDRLAKSAMACVILQKVSHSFRLSQLIDCHDLDLFRLSAFVQRSQHAASDAAKSINCDV
ncbi:hypothetical protein GCM10007086_33500 [Photobacterium aphoticum]|nr:hypothetical protein GCM10007086_33500 [Photobacterium aphoticum]